MVHKQDADNGEATTMVCSACRGSYRLPKSPSGALLCPHCRAAIGNPAASAKLAAKRKPSAWRNNRNAASLALLSELVLIAAVFFPFMSVNKLGSSHTYSLIGGIAELWRQQEMALALIIGGFSLIFPIAKNVLLVAATTSLFGLGHSHRKVIHAAAALTAKYSMLDVFVAAVLVVVVKLGRATEVVVRSGLFMFCGAIALSMLASACAHFEDEA